MEQMEAGKKFPRVLYLDGIWAPASNKPFLLNMGDHWMLWYNGRKGSKEQIGSAVHAEPELNF